MPPQIRARYCPGPEVAVANPTVRFIRIQAGDLSAYALHEFYAERLHTFQQGGAILKRQFHRSFQDERCYRIQVVPNDIAAEPHRLKRNAPSARCRIEDSAHTLRRWW